MIFNIIGKGNPTQIRSTIQKNDLDSKTDDELQNELISAINEFSEKLADVEFMKKYMKEGAPPLEESAQDLDDQKKDGELNININQQEVAIVKKRSGNAELNRISKDIAKNIDNYTKNLKKNGTNDSKKARPNSLTPKAFPLNTEKLKFQILQKNEHILASEIQDSISQIEKQKGTTDETSKEQKDPEQRSRQYNELISKIKRSNFEEEEQLKDLKLEINKNSDFESNGKSLFSVVFG